MVTLSFISTAPMATWGLHLFLSNFMKTELLGGKAVVVFESHISAHVIIIGMYE